MVQNSDNVASCKRTCPVCKEPLPVYVCKVCGNLQNRIDDNVGKQNAITKAAYGALCNSCFTKMSSDAFKANYHIYPIHCRSLYEKMQDAWTRDRCDAWRKLVSGASTHSLTEEEWQEACLYFEKCAICREGAISAKLQFFPDVPYCSYNVVPVCQGCCSAIANSTVAQQYPLTIVHTRTRYRPAYFRRLFKKGFLSQQRIMDYLFDQLLKADNPPDTKEWLENGYDAVHKPPAYKRDEILRDVTEKLEQMQGKASSSSNNKS